MIKKAVNRNCNYCNKYKINCDGDDNFCICRSCPRNLGECLITKYCRETESVLDSELKNEENKFFLIEEYFKNR